MKTLPPGELNILIKLHLFQQYTSYSITVSHMNKTANCYLPFLLVCTDKYFSTDFLAGK